MMKLCMLSSWHWWSPRGTRRSMVISWWPDGNKKMLRHHRHQHLLRLQQEPNHRGQTTIPRVSLKKLRMRQMQGPQLAILGCRLRKTATARMRIKMLEPLLGLVVLELWPAFTKSRSRRPVTMRRTRRLSSPRQRSCRKLHRQVVSTRCKSRRRMKIARRLSQCQSLLLRLLQPWPPALEWLASTRCRLWRPVKVMMRLLLQ
mmetsp:Transcript_57189/g.100072  ORF Transcript_57189/g.100072 Transcript_57189/m.100072 type:complete len:202 (+) Transcript_57189:1010-1615(+)